MFSQKDTLRFLLSDRTVGDQAQDKTAEEKEERKIDRGKSSHEKREFGISHRDSCTALTRDYSLWGSSTLLRGCVGQPDSSHGC